MVGARLRKKVRLDVFVASPIHFWLFLIERPKLQSALNVSARCLGAETFSCPL